MDNHKFSKTKSVFLKFMLAMLFIVLVISYISSSYAKNYVSDNFAQNEVKKISDLVFEVIYTKMEDGWSRDDLKTIITRLTNLEHGLKIKTYRSEAVEEVYGVRIGDAKAKEDPLVQKAFRGESVFFDNGKNVRYIQPMLVQDKCIQCHANTSIGDVNGVIDMEIPINDIKLSLNTIIAYFLVFVLVLSIIMFFIFQIMINKLFITPISTIANSIKNFEVNKDYKAELKCSSKLLELNILVDAFNNLLSKVSQSIQEHDKKNQMLEEYKKVIDMSTIVSKTNVKGIITYVNDEFCKISGYSPDELIGKNHNIVRSPNMPKEAFADLWATIKQGNPWHGIVENKKKNGESYFLNVTIMPLFNQNHEIVEYIAIRDDITEFRNLQMTQMKDNVNDALEIKYDEVLEDIPVYAIVVNKDCIIEHANNLFRDRFSYSPLEDIAINTMFIEKYDYLSTIDPFCDWKQTAASLQEDFRNKVLIEIFSEEIEFNIYLKKLNDNDDYLIVLTEVNNQSILG